MNKCLLLVNIAAFIFILFGNASAQVNQTVADNASTTAISFPGAGCTYNWVNSNPLIGLKATGTGDIPSFTAVNNSNVPIIATITATPDPLAYAYLANFHDSTLSVVDITTGNKVAAITVGGSPFGVAANRDGSLIYAASLANNAISVINTTTNTVLDVIGVGNSPIGVLISPDGQRVYTTNENSSNISVISTATDKVIDSIAVGAPYGIATSPDGSLLYVSNLGSGNGASTLSVLNSATGKLITTIPVGTYPGGVAISPDGKRVYVACTMNSTDGASNCYVINTATNSVVATIPVGASSIGVVVSADGSRVYTTDTGWNLGTATISVIDTKINKVVANIKTGEISIGLALSPDGTKLIATNDYTNELLIINTATNTITSQIPEGNDPDSFGNFVIGGTGCSSVPITYTITVYPANYNPNIVIPNAFTPNGDGINDTWNIKNLEAYGNCSVDVFNRYGARVYSSAGYHVSWDGRYKGAALPMGSYYYVIDLKNGSPQLSGPVSIIR